MSCIIQNPSLYEMCVDISREALTNGRFCQALNFQKILEKIRVEKIILSNEKNMKNSGDIFNSTCLPSGNLVDGLPLGLHTDAR